MRFIVPNEKDSNVPIGSRYCVTDSNTLISYDSDTAYYYTRISAAQGDWLFTRSSRWRDYSYSSNPCLSYASYSVSQQYTPLDFSSTILTNGVITFAILTLPIVGIVAMSRFYRLFRHRV